jgi:hypothetical protein
LCISFQKQRNPENLSRTSGNIEEILSKRNVDHGMNSGARKDSHREKTLVIICIESINYLKVFYPC